MEGFSFVTPVTGLNRLNSGKEDDVFFPYSLAFTFGRGKFCTKMGGPLVRRLPVKWSAISESLRNTALFDPANRDS
jgi:hypothetical protein